MSNSDRTTIQIAEEATFGTAPSSGYEIARFTGETMGRDTGTTNSGTIRSDRNVEDVVRTTVEGNCELSQEMDLSTGIQLKLLAASVGGEIVEEGGTASDNELLSGSGASDEWLWKAYNASADGTTVPIHGITQDANDVYSFGSVQKRNWYRSFPVSTSGAKDTLNAGNFLRVRDTVATPLIRVAHNENVIPTSIATVAFDYTQKQLTHRTEGLGFTVKHTQVGPSACTITIDSTKLRHSVTTGGSTVNTDFAFSTYPSLTTLTAAIEAGLDKVTATLHRGPLLNTTGSMLSSFLGSNPVSNVDILNTTAEVRFDRSFTVDTDASTDYDTLTEVVAFINTYANQGWSATLVAAGSTDASTFAPTVATNCRQSTAAASNSGTLFFQTTRTVEFEGADIAADATSATGDALEMQRYTIVPGTGDFDKTFCMQKSFLDVDSGQGEQATGMGIDSVAWSISPENMLSQTYSFKGEDVSHLSGLTSSGQVAASTRKILNAQDHLGAVFYSTNRDNDNPATVRAHTMLRPLDGVFGVELSVSQGLRAQTEIGFQGPQSFGRGPLKVTGSLSVYYDDYMSVIMDKFYEGFEDVELCIAFNEFDASRFYYDTFNNGDSDITLLGGRDGSQNHALVIEMPRVKFTGGTRHATGTGTDVVAELNFEAFYDANDERSMRYILFAPTGLA